MEILQDRAYLHKVSYSAAAIACVQYRAAHGVPDVGFVHEMHEAW